MNSSFGTSSGPSALLRFNCFVAFFTYPSVIGFLGPVCLCFNYFVCILFVHSLYFSFPSLAWYKISYYSAIYSLVSSGSCTFLEENTCTNLV